MVCVEGVDVDLCCVVVCCFVEEIGVDVEMVGDVVCCEGVGDIV